MQNQRSTNEFPLLISLLCLEFSAIRDSQNPVKFQLEGYYVLTERWF